MADQPLQNVRVVDVEMPFFSMVGFMVKWAFAAIPALIVIAILWGMLGVILAAMGLPFLRP